MDCNINSLLSLEIINNIIAVIVTLFLQMESFVLFYGQIPIGCVMASAFVVITNLFCNHHSCNSINLCTSCQNVFVFERVFITIP